MRGTAFAGCALWLALFAAQSLDAATTPEVSAQLSRLTPVGAERAANKDGTIPAWVGGFTSASPGYRADAPRSDPFAHEKPLFSITSENFHQYAERLPEGQKALFEKYSDYRMDVYPSHRTAAFPQDVYENIRRNASRAHAAPEGIAHGVEGAAGGIPFPVPANGMEVVWNHLLAYWGPARELHLNTYVVTADGASGLATSYREIADVPFYYPGATPASYGGFFFQTPHLKYGPPGQGGAG